MTTEASPATDTIEPLVDVADTTAAAPEPATDAIATPSSAETIDAKVEAPRDLKSVLRDAIKKTEAPAAPSTVKADQEAVAVDPAQAAETADVPEAEVPFHNHPRWQAMLKERDTLRPLAENYTKITDYMTTSGLEPKEVAEGFEIMAQIKSNDPGQLAKVRDWFSERLNWLNTTLGDAIPADLQAKVDDGSMDLTDAQDFSRTRANEARLTASRAADNARVAEQTRADDSARVSQELATAVNGWEVEIRAKDPDYAKKAALVETQVRAIVQRVGRPPANAAEARHLANAAYAEVNASLKAFVPRPRAITPPASTQSTRQSNAPPTSLREAIRAAVSR